MTKQIPCIICEEVVSRSEMMNHIAEDINYFRNRCKRCDFKTADSLAIVEHELETGHIVKKGDANRYLERLCTIIYSDCAFGARHGLEAVFDRNFQPVGAGGKEFVSPTTSREDFAAPESSTPTSTANLRAAITPTFEAVKKSVSHEFVQAEGDEEEVAASHSVSSSAKARLETNECSKRDSTAKKRKALSSPRSAASKNKRLARTASASRATGKKNGQRGVLAAVTTAAAVEEDPLVLDATTVNAAVINDDTNEMINNSLMENNGGDMLDALRHTNRAFEPTKKCTKCSLTVPNDYRSHKEHVLKRHLTEEGGSAEEDCDPFIAKFIQCCFPGAIANNDYQCCLCGHELRSASGRRGHVGREHLYYCIPCPRQTCLSTFFTIENLSLHLKNEHTASSSLNSEERDALKRTKQNYNRRLGVLLARCFPFPLPSANCVLSLALPVFAADEGGAVDSASTTSVADNANSTAIRGADVGNNALSFADSRGSSNCSARHRTTSSMTAENGTPSALTVPSASSLPKSSAPQQEQPQKSARLKFSSSSSSGDSSGDERASIASTEASRARRQRKIAMLVDEINTKKRDDAFCLKNRAATNASQDDGKSAARKANGSKSSSSSSSCSSSPATAREEMNGGGVSSTTRARSSSSSASVVECVHEKPPVEVINVADDEEDQKDVREATAAVHSAVFKRIRRAEKAKTQWNTGSGGGSGASASSSHEPNLNESLQSLRVEVSTDSRKGKTRKSGGNFTPISTSWSPFPGDDTSSKHQRNQERRARQRARRRGEESGTQRSSSRAGESSRCARDPSNRGSRGASCKRRASPKRSGGGAPKNLPTKSPIASTSNRRVSGNEVGGSPASSALSSMYKSAQARLRRREREELERVGHGNDIGPGAGGGFANEAARRHSDYVRGRTCSRDRSRPPPRRSMSPAQRGGHRPGRACTPLPRFDSSRPPPLLANRPFLPPVHQIPIPRSRSRPPLISVNPLAPLVFFPLTPHSTERVAQAHPSKEVPRRRWDSVATVSKDRVSQPAASGGRQAPPPATTNAPPSVPAAPTWHTVKKEKADWTTNASSSSNSSAAARSENANSCGNAATAWRQSSPRKVVKCETGP